MVGITSAGAYIPYRRLSRELIGKAWNRNSLKGERSIANNDEDSITMAVEAASNCIGSEPRESVEALLFASTSAPYKEKLSAGLVSTVCNLRDQVFTADYANSLRAGTAALRSAINMVKAGDAGRVLVTAADCRLGYPKSDEEQLLGDGAAAIMVGDKGIIATVEATFSINKEIVDVWRNDKDQFVRTGESRFIMTEGYNACMKEAVTGILKKSGLTPGDIQKVVLTTPNMKANLDLAKKTGFDTKTQVQDNLMLSVGNCGSAQPLMLLTAALEDAKPGDLILLAGYGDGADAFIFKATDEINKFKPLSSIEKYLRNKSMLSTYQLYLSFRGIIEPMPGEPFRLFPSNSAYWREQESILQFLGSRCKKCGASIFPIQRICFSCGAKDEFDKIPCYSKKGKVFTYSIDKLAGRSDEPVVIQTVVDADDRTRFYLIMTDYDPSELKVGLEVEFTFREIYKGANFNNYYWKCRPVRNGGAS